MKNKLMMKNILWVLLGASSLIYIYNAFMNSFNMALLTVILTLIIFVSLSLMLNIFDLGEFIIILSISGFIVSLTMFFYYGIEEVPYPYGAILFHFDGIWKSLIMCFASSIPLLIFFKGSSNLTNSNNIEHYNNDWEIATVDDLDSGQFEVN